MNKTIITLTPSFHSGLWKSWDLKAPISTFHTYLPSPLPLPDRRRGCWGEKGEAVGNVRSINYPSTNLSIFHSQLDNKTL